MNPYIKNLDRIEFVVTFACTGKCKHCSEGDHSGTGEHIDGAVASEAVRRIAGEHDIKSLMTFGGEPLLHADTVCMIHSAARDMGIPKRQLITNGFFSRDTDVIRNTAQKLAESGVNDILLSVDAFHQETIPMAPVMAFAEAVSAYEGVRIRVHPAWLVSQTSDNPYNNKTRAVLEEFQRIGIEASSGNVIFPSGNALLYLREYFDMSRSYENPYSEDPYDIRAVSVSPNGDVFGGNIYKTDILEILENYTPDKK